MWRVRTFFQRQELSNRSQVNKAIEKQIYEEVKENKHHTGTTNYPLNLVLRDLIYTNIQYSRRRLGPPVSNESHSLRGVNNRERKIKLPITGKPTMKKIIV